MSASAPWSVKGIDPKAREAAKALARRSGLTLGEWLNQMILEDDEAPAGPDLSAPIPLDRRRAGRWDIDAATPRSDTAERALAAIEALSQRIEAAERRSAAAVGGVEAAVTDLSARLQTQESAHQSAAAELKYMRRAYEHGKNRLDHLEGVVKAPQPDTLGALKGLEQALVRLGGQVQQVEQSTQKAYLISRRDHADLEQRLVRIESPEQVSETLVEAVAARLTERLDAAELRTRIALGSLHNAMGELERRLGGAEEETSRLSASNLGLSNLAADLTRSVEAAREELIGKIHAAARRPHPQISAAVGAIARDVQALESRSMDAVKTMGQQVLKLAQQLNGRIEAHKLETRTAQAKVNVRLNGVEAVQGAALSELSADIARVADRLAQRIEISERRAVDAYSDVNARIERIASKTDAALIMSRDEIAARLKDSEGRAENAWRHARERIEARLTEAEARLDAQTRPQEPATVARAAASAEPAAEEAPVWTPAPADEFDIDFELPSALTVGYEEGVKQGHGAAPLPDDVQDSEFGDLDPDETFELHALHDLPDSYDAHVPGPEVTLNDEDPLAAPHVVVARPETAAEEPLESIFARLHRRDFDTGAPSEFAADDWIGPSPLSSTRDAIEAARQSARLAASTGKVGSLRQPRGDSTGRSPKNRRSSGGLTTALGASAIAATLASLWFGSYALLTDGDGDTANKPSEPKVAAKTPAKTPAAAAPVQLAATALEKPAPDDRLSFYNRAKELQAAEKPGYADLYLKAANLGLPQAQTELFFIYRDGLDGKPQDKVQAVEWARRAAEGGDPQGQSVYGAELAVKGEGAEAVALLTKAARAGYVDAQYNLGRIYANGIGVKKDLGLSYRWYSIAVDHGDSAAVNDAADVAKQLPADVLVAQDAEVQAFRAHHPASPQAAR